MKRSGWVVLIVLCVAVVWAVATRRADQRADAAWAVRDAALHDSLEVVQARIGQMDQALAEAERQRRAALAAARTEERAADAAAAQSATLRDSALVAVADARVTRDSLGALLRAMAAQEIARERAAQAERTAHQAAVAADSGVIAGLRAGLAQRDTALALSGKALDLKDAQIRTLERGGGWRVRAASGVVLYGVSGTCAALGWLAAGPAGGIASGAVCAVGWSVLR